MALTGNWTKYTTTYSNENTTQEEVTYPADLPEIDPNYDKRGTTETITVQVPIVTTEEFTDAYVVIKSASVYAHNILGIGKTKNLNVQYRVYNSKAEHDEDFDNHIHEDLDVQLDWDWEGETNPFTTSYEWLKAQPGFENLINA